MVCQNVCTVSPRVVKHVSISIQSERLVRFQLAFSFCVTYDVWLLVGFYCVESVQHLVPSYCCLAGNYALHVFHAFCGTLLLKRLHVLRCIVSAAHVIILVSGLPPQRICIFNSGLIIIFASVFCRHEHSRREH